MTLNRNPRRYLPPKVPMKTRSRNNAQMSVFQTAKNAGRMTPLNQINGKHSCIDRDLIESEELEKSMNSSQMKRSKIS